MSDENDKSKITIEYTIKGFFKAAFDVFMLADEKLNEILEVFNPGFEHPKVEGPNTNYTWISNHLKERNNKLNPIDPLLPEEKEDEKSIVNTVLGFNNVKLTDFNDSFGAAFTLGTTLSVLTTIVAFNSSTNQKIYKDPTLRFMKAHRIGLITGLFFGVITYADFELCNKAICNKYFKVGN